MIEDLFEIPYLFNGLVWLILFHKSLEYQILKLRESRRILISSRFFEREQVLRKKIKVFTFIIFAIDYGFIFSFKQRGNYFSLNQSKLQHNIKVLFKMVMKKGEDFRITGKTRPGFTSIYIGKFR